MGAEVPGIQFHGESGAQSGGSRRKRYFVQKRKCGTDATDAGCECGENAEELGNIFAAGSAIFGQSRRPSVVET